MSNLNYDTISYLVYGFGGVITEFNTFVEAKEHVLFLKTFDPLF